MQDSLFNGVADAIPKPLKKAAGKVGAVSPDQELVALAAALPGKLRLGTSSWSYPGWSALVWDREYPEATLSRHGLAAYARHPLFRTVSVDRSFYRALDVAQFMAYAAQVGEDFRFVVKAPSLITDAMLRNESGHGMRRNTFFLDAEQAMQIFIKPAMQGLGKKLGALVFQISPLPDFWLERMPELTDRLHSLLSSLPDLRSNAPDGVVAVEVRDSAWLTPRFVQALKDSGATYCMGLHAKMPRIAEQLPILRALWPGPLVCRWNLNPLHGAYGYDDAQRQYEPYDKVMDPDPETRIALARVIAGTTNAGQNAYVTLSNQAEGCAPLSVIELARAVRNLKA